MMKININEPVIIIKNVTIPAEKILKKFYFIENTETGQGVLKQLDLMEYYFEKATEKEKKIIEKIIPYNNPEKLFDNYYNEHVYMIVI